MRIAYFDCFAGISGDMTLGALLDAGLSLDALQTELGRLALPGWRLDVKRVQKQGLSATQITVVLEPAAQPQRHLSDILALLDAGDLASQVHDRAAAVFRRLATAEAAVHGSSIDEVHFHEVGAVDSIIDIVGAVAGLALLGVGRISASPLPLGHGFVRAAHGQLPVPAPAVVAILAGRGVPVRDRDVATELVTPTGAALLAELATDFGPYPAMTLRATGFGAGTRDMPYPNVLRVVLGDAGEGADDDLTVDRLLLLETNIDDMNPELIAYASLRLFDAGALDVWLVPISMKKGRPATLLSVLCDPAQGETLTRLILTETTTLGVRRQWIERACVARSFETVATPWGPVQVKVAHLPGGARKGAPEYEDCRRLAEAAGVPLREVYAAADSAWQSR